MGIEFGCGFPNSSFESISETGIDGSKSKGKSTLYTCTTCGAIFLFREDVEDHQQRKEHVQFIEAKF